MSQKFSLTENVVKKKNIEKRILKAKINVLIFINIKFYIMTRF